MTSYIIYAVVLIVAGILASPSIILSKKPNAKELIDKIAPFQAIIGVLVFIWGIYDLIAAIRSIGLLSLGATWAILWVLILVTGIVEIGLGFLLGFSLMNKYVFSKNEKSAEKGQELLAKVVPFQGKLGLAGVILGIIFLIFIIII